jgi:hypothetical protein
VIAFGVGKRSCIGQSLAEKEFFIFLSGLLHRYGLKIKGFSTLKIELHFIKNINESLYFYTGSANRLKIKLDFTYIDRITLCRKHH